MFNKRVGSNNRTEKCFELHAVRNNRSNGGGGRRLKKAMKLYRRLYLVRKISGKSMERKEKNEEKGDTVISKR